MVNQNDDRKIESELRIVRRVAGEAGFDVTYLRRRRGPIFPDCYRTRRGFHLPRLQVTRSAA